MSETPPPAPLGDAAFKVLALFAELRGAEPGTVLADAEVEDRLGEVPEALDELRRDGFVEPSAQGLRLTDAGARFLTRHWARFDPRES